MCFMIYGSKRLDRRRRQNLDRQQNKPSRLRRRRLERDGQMFSGPAARGRRHAHVHDRRRPDLARLAKRFSHLGLFNDKILVASRGKGIVRSDDSGATWTDVSDITPAASVLHVRDGVGYCHPTKVCSSAAIKAKTWKVEGAALSCAVGPLWGKLADHIVVSSPGRLSRTKERRQNLATRRSFTRRIQSRWRNGPKLRLGSINNIFYASSMGKEALKYQAVNDGRVRVSSPFSAPSQISAFEKNSAQKPSSV